MQDRPEAENGGPAQPDIGARVNGIIEAAERAAAEILGGAEAKAHAQIEELTRESRELRDEADQYARDMREAAVAEAEAKARQLVREAEREAERIQQEVGQRHEALKREARMLEERRHRVLESLRDLSAQLQDALVEPSEMRRRDPSLEEALDVERRR